MTPETRAVRQTDALEQRAEKLRFENNWFDWHWFQGPELNHMMAGCARQEVAAERQRVIDAINAIGEPLEQGDWGDGFNQGWARAKDLIVAAIRKLGGTE